MCICHFIMYLVWMYLSMYTCAHCMHIVGMYIQVNGYKKQSLITIIEYKKNYFIKIEKFIQ